MAGVLEVVSCAEPSLKVRSFNLEITCVNDSVDKFSLAITALWKGLRASLRPSF